MPKFQVGFTGYASYGVTVEADDEIEARDKASEVDAPALCAHCSGFWNAGKENVATDVELGTDWDINSIEEK